MKTQSVAASDPIVQQKSRVTVRRPGMPAYSYVTNKPTSMDAWLEAFELALRVNPSSGIWVSVMSIRDEA